MTRRSYGYSIWVGGVALLVATSLALSACGESRSEAGTANVARTARVRADAAPAEKPAPLAPAFPPPQKILFVGDSVADTLDEALAAVAADHGVPFTASVVAGCGSTGGTPADESGVPFPHAPVCRDGIPETQQRMVAQEQPDLVVWLSVWEISNRIVNGQVEKVGSLEANELLMADIDEAVGRLTAGGARLVFVAPAPPAAESGEPYDPEQAAALQRLAVLLREYARAHPATVTVVELSDIVCPSGPPCPADVGGFRPRATDGNHFEGPGAAWVAEQLFPKLLGAAAMTSAPEPTANAGVAPAG
jgi:hypothetical protein